MTISMAMGITTSMAMGTTTSMTISISITSTTTVPVILPDDAYDLWLDPGFQKPDAISDLLKPFDPSLMRRFEVSSRVNFVKNDDAACAESVVLLSTANA